MLVVYGNTLRGILDKWLGQVCDKMEQLNLSGRPEFVFSAVFNIPKIARECILIAAISADSGGNCAWWRGSSLYAELYKSKTLTASCGISSSGIEDAWLMQIFYFALVVCTLIFGHCVNTSWRLRKMRGEILTASEWSFFLVAVRVQSTYRAQRLGGIQTKDPVTKIWEIISKVLPSWDKDYCGKVRAVVGLLQVEYF